MGLLVRMANFAVAHSGRTEVDWLHLAGPRYLRSEDRSSCRELAELEPGEARVFLGIVLPINGVAGLRRRQGKPRRGTFPPSAWRCTADSAASPAQTAPRPCASTPASSAPTTQRAVVQVGTSRLTVTRLAAGASPTGPGRSFIGSRIVASPACSGRDPGAQLVHRRAAEFGQRHGHAGHRDLEEARHSSSSKLTTDICPGTSTPARAAPP